MSFKEIAIQDLKQNAPKLIGKDWMLICGGMKDNYNMMTASWGGLGELWSKPVAFIFIRPSRYTYDYIEGNDFFSLNFFTRKGKVPRKYKKLMNWMGSHSGKDINKMDNENLTSLEDGGIPTTYFEESSIVILCKKIYYQDLVPEQFLDNSIEENYNGKDYHRMFVGEILKTYKDDNI